MDISILSQIRIILVEPAGALNVGSVARVMKNMGFNQLILVKPHCNPSDEDARHMAVHGVDVLENAILVNSLPEALTGCQRAIATTAHSRSLNTPFETPRQALPWLLDSHSNTALIFGPEDRGLSNQELNYAQRFISIPANPEYSSLNLAQAVAVCVYELYQLVIQSDSDVWTPKPGKANLASLDVLEGYYQELETLLLEVGFLYPHTAKARMEKLRGFYNQAQLTTEDVTMLRGMLRQINWALKQKDRE